jgi:transcriptional regulator with PAS, ATPase and Fis domain
MTIAELKHQLITKALKKHNGNAELAALEVGVSAKTIYIFKLKQKIKTK